MIGADSNGINVVIYCWVNNSDWFGVRSELWKKIISELIMSNKMAMSRPQQDIHIINQNT